MVVMGWLVGLACALGALTALFVLTRKIFDTWTAQLATCIFAALPGFVINAHYFKTDVPMTCWMLVTLVFAYRLLDTGNPRDVLWLGFLVGYTPSITYTPPLFLFLLLIPPPTA